MKNNIDRDIAGDAIDNMKNFINAAKFKKATLTYLASKLPENCIEDLRKAFIQIDVNGDGRIQAPELKKAL